MSEAQGADDSAQRAVTPQGAEAGVWRFLWVLQRVFSFPAMLGMMLVGAAFYSGRGFAVDPDLWWHAKNGLDILTTHKWPTTDPFSFTVAGTPWLAYEWLGDVVIGAVSRLGGIRGLDILLIALGGAIMIALYGYATLRAQNSKAGFVAALVLFVFANPSFSLRPQMFGYFFLILTLIALEYFRQGKMKALWFLPPLFLLWVNTHGSWVIGFGVMVVFWASGLVEFRAGGVESKRWHPAERVRLELVFALCLAMIPFTPYGTRLAAYPFMVASSLPLNVAHVLEWLPMPMEMLGGKIFLCLVIGFFLIQIISGNKYRLHEWVLFIGGTAMAFLHVRFVLLFVPFFAPLFAAMLARWIPKYERHKDKYILNAILMGAVCMAIAHYMPTAAELTEIVSRSFPVKAVAYMGAHDVPRPMYNTYGYGGYLIGAFPNQKVFIDGRGDLYELGGAFADYLEVSSLRPAAFSVLRSYGIKSCLLDRKEALATVMEALPEWKRVYSDDVSVLFVRRDATPD